MVDLSTYGRVSRTLPQPFPDTQEIEERLSRYGDQYIVSVMPTKHLLADEGTYFVATNPTPGTALAFSVQTTFSNTVPFAYIYNNDKPTNPSYKRIFLDYVKLVVTIAAAAGTQAYFAINLDTVARTLGANMTAITPVSPNMDVSPTSVTLVYTATGGSASTITAPSAAARYVSRGAFGGLTAVGDELVMMFGSPDVGSYPGLTAAQATCPGRKCSNSAPIAIGPGQSAAIYLWFPGNTTTGLSYELEMGWWER